jgi:hypothetical protein
MRGLTYLSFAVVFLWQRGAAMDNHLWLIWLSFPGVLGLLATVQLGDDDWREGLPVLAWSTWLVASSQLSVLRPLAIWPVDAALFAVLGAFAVFLSSNVGRRGGGPLWFPLIFAIGVFLMMLAPTSGGAFVTLWHLAAGVPPIVATVVWCRRGHHRWYLRWRS